jgi:tetratricopeptide (TPR) repeat protein
MATESAEYFYNKGITYYQEGKYNIAIDNLKKALELKPDFAECYYNLGNTYFKRKEYDMAIDAYNKGLAIKSDDLQSFYNLAIIYTWKKEFDLAIEFYNKIMTIIPDNPDVYEELGNIYFKKNDYDNSIDYYNKGLSINPYSISLKESLDKVLEIKKIEEEKNKKVEEPKPEIKENADEPFNLAINYVKEKNFTFAIDCLRKCLKINPDYPNAFDLLNKLLPLASLSQTEPDEKNYLKLGMEYLEKEKIDIAEDVLNRAVSVSNNPAETYFNIGIIYLQKKKYDLSMENLKKCSEIDPNSNRAKEYLYKVLMLKNSGVA